jgi:hypothetical protein
MTDRDEPGAPARPARLPRERDVPRAKATLAGPVGPPSPAGPRRGLNRPMKAVLVGVGVVGVLSLALIRCADRGKPTKARTHWNAPPQTTRQASVDDLLRQASVRAAEVLPAGRLARLEVRQIDRAGMVHLDYGSASFEFEAPDADPCSVHLVMSWQGWAQRPGGACHAAPRPPTCGFGAVLERAFRGRTDETATLEYDGGWSIWFRDAGSAQQVEVADDCNPG